MATIPYQGGDWEKSLPNKPHTYTYPHIKEAPQRPATLNDLFPSYSKWAIGLDPVFDNLRQVSNSFKQAAYPPYNLYKNKDSYVLELAVAGFTKEDITISVKELTLTVEGELEPSESEPIHKGIATRNFKQNFALGEYVVVTGAELKDGMLRITLEQQLPEEKKAKIVEIQ